MKNKTAYIIGGLILLVIIVGLIIWAKNKKPKGPLTNDEKLKLAIQRTNECQGQPPLMQPDTRVVNGIKIRLGFPYKYHGEVTTYLADPVTGYHTIKQVTPAFCSPDPTNPVWLNELGHYVDPKTGKEIVAGFGKG